MKERPILFNSPMVRKVLDDTKLQTRRIVKWRDLTPGLNLSFTGLKPYSYAPGLFTLEVPTRNGWARRSGPTRCPYGQPGDRLWVREAFAIDDNGHEEWPVFRADGVTLPVLPPSRGSSSWKPSIHMPRWASRTTLEVTDVRVERLQDISEEDAKAEGCDCLTWSGEPGMADLIDWPLKTVDRPWANGFALLWESINGDNSWTRNPWVWAVSFKRVEQAA